MLKKITRLKLGPGFFLCAIISLIFFRWFISGILTYGDWSFHYQDEMRQWLQLPSIWNAGTGLGGINLTAGTWPFYFLGGVFGFFGFDSGVSDKFVFMFPIAVACPAGAYYLAREFNFSRMSSFLTCTVYSLNTYFLLISTTQLTLLAAYSFSTFSLAYFVRTFKTLKLRDAIKCGLVTTLVSIYEFRVFYILFFIFLIYAACYLFSNYSQHKIKSYIMVGKYFSIILAIVLLLNIYWLFGLSQVGSVTNNALFDRGLFGSNFLNLRYALTLYHPFWTGGEPKAFVIQSIPLYQWLLPAAGILGVWLSRTKKVFFFSWVLLLGLLLTKQEAAPFTSLYYFLYTHVPGFNAFREASKFFFLIALSYAFLIGNAFEILSAKLRSTKRAKAILYTGYASIMVLCAINALPLISGSIKTLYVSRHIPKEYSVLKTKQDSEKDFYRVLYVPIDSKWGSNDQLHPRVGAAALIPQTSINYDNGSQLVSQASSDQIKALLTSNWSKGYADYSSYKYVILPIRDTANDADSFVFYGDDRGYYKDLLDSLPWLRKTNIGTSDLLVYENTSYKPYFSAANQLNSISSFTKLNQNYAFQSDALGKSNFNFTERSSSANARTRDLIDISDDLTRSNLKSGRLSISDSLSLDKDNKLYANTGQLNYSYGIKDKTITFTANNENDLVINGADIGAALKSDPISSATLLADKDYYIALNDNLLRINPNESQSRNLGVSDDGLAMYSSDSNTNLLQNGSFEKGAWQHEVEDCNNYGTDSAIGMKLASRLKTKGKYSLELNADRHVACTRSENIEVNPGSEYSLSYDYFIRGGQKAGYDIVFNNPAHTVLHGAQNSISGKWFTLNTKLKVPGDATQFYIKLKGFPDEQNKQHAKNYYDNVHVRQVSLVLPISTKSNPSYKQIELGQSKVRAAIVNDKFDFANLIQNPSLESGTWQKTIGDCNNYDDKPLIGMQLDKKDKTDGKQSLELSATRHVACTGPKNVSVDEGKDYLLSFDYQSPNADVAGYFVSFNDPSGTTINERIPITDNKWHTLTKPLTIPYGATSFSLSVYSYADSYGGIKIINRYDNFSLVRIPPIINRYYVVSEPKTKLVTPKSITYKLDGETKKEVSIHGASTAFYLNMSEAYHPSWYLRLNENHSASSASTISEKDHFNYDNYLNSWYVDPVALCKDKSTACSRNSDGSYNLKMIAEFTPQRYFYIGLVVSGLTLVGCIGYLARGYLPKREHFKGWRYVGPR